MQTQRNELLKKLSEHGWRVAKEEANLQWWADEIWQLESTWSPVGGSAFVSFLVDPMFVGNRKKGEAVWAVLASSDVPSDRLATPNSFTLSLGNKWRDNLPDLLNFLSAIRSKKL